MSLRQALQEGARPGIELSGYSPDRAYIRSDGLSSHLTSAVRVDEEGQRYLLLSHLWRVSNALDSWDWDGDRPEWLAIATQESRWAHDTVRQTQSGVAWMVADRVVIGNKFTLTLSERVSSLEGSLSVYSQEMRSWVVIGATVDGGDLEDLIEEYSITPSPMVSAAIAGRERWREHLDRHVARAREMGYDIPRSFKTDRTLKPHQEESAIALAGMGSGILADQVGLGKGGSFVSAFLSRVERQLADSPGTRAYPLVVCCTKSMKDEIAEEILRWKADAVVEILEGTKPSPVDDDTEFIVLNVDILHHRLDDVVDADPVGLVVDEAHTLKNEDAKRTQAAQRLADHLRAEHGDQAPIWLTSGTPFLNWPIELWSLLRVLGKEGIFSSHAMEALGTEKVRIRTARGWQWRDIWPKRAFEIRWCGGHYDSYKKWVNGDATNTAELNRLLLEHAMVRRKKSDVMSPLPELSERMALMEPDLELYEEYLEIERNFVDWMKERAKEEAEEEGIPLAEAIRVVYAKLASAEAVMRMTALRQAVAKAKLAGVKDWVHRFMEGDPDITGGDPSRRKVILFAYHKEIQQRLIEDPELQKHGMATIVHGQDQGSIQEGKRRFQRDSDCRLMVCYSGAREGHTLTAAKDVLLVEIPLVPTWVVQMAGRCWARISEDFDPHEATVHYAAIPGTVDSLSMSRVKLKKAMFDAVIDGEESETLSEYDSSNQEQAEVLMELMSKGHKAIGIAG